MAAISVLDRRYHLNNSASLAVARLVVCTFCKAVILQCHTFASKVEWLVHQGRRRFCDARDLRAVFGTRIETRKGLFLANRFFFRRSGNPLKEDAEAKHGSALDFPNSGSHIISRVKATATKNRTPVRIS